LRHTRVDFSDLTYVVQLHVLKNYFSTSSFAGVTHWVRLTFAKTKGLD